MLFLSSSPRPRDRCMVNLRRLVCCWIVCLCATTLLPTATARSHREGKSKHHRKDGDTSALQRGSAALAAGDLATAGPLLSDAYRADPGPATLYQLGRLALAEGRALDAYDLMRRFLADPDLETSSDAAPPPNAQTGSTGAAPPNVQPVDARPLAAEIKEAERVTTLPHPPGGTLNIQGERGSLIVLDGRVVGVLPLPLPLYISPAEHKLVVERGGRRIEDQVQIAVGRLGEVRTDLSSHAFLLSVLPAVLLIEEFQDVPPELRLRLQAAVEKALLRSRVSPLSKEQALAQAQTPRLQSCVETRGCQIELARKVEAGAVLAVQATQSKSGLQLRVALWDLDVGEEASAQDQICGSCTPDQSSAALQDLTGRAYVQGSARGKGQLSVTSTPAGADVFINDKPAGVAPWNKFLFAGSYLVTVRKDALPAEKRDVTLGAGEERRLDVALSAPEPPPAPLIRRFEQRRAPRPVWRLVLGGVMAAGGVTTGAFGIGALSIDGQCNTPGPDVNSTCQLLYRTGTIGGILLGAGVALTASGITLMALPGPMRTVEVSP